MRIKTAHDKKDIASIVVGEVFTVSGEYYLATEIKGGILRTFSLKKETMDDWARAIENDDQKFTMCVVDIIVSPKM